MLIVLLYGTRTFRFISTHFYCYSNFLPFCWIQQSYIMCTAKMKLHVLSVLRWNETLESQCSEMRQWKPLYATGPTDSCLAEPETGFGLVSFRHLYLACWLTGHIIHNLGLPPRTARCGLLYVYPRGGGNSSWLAGTGWQEIIPAYCLGLVRDWTAATDIVC